MNSIEQDEMIANVRARSRREIYKVIERTLDDMITDLCGEELRFALIIQETGEGSPLTLLANANSDSTRKMLIDLGKTIEVQNATENE